MHSRRLALLFPALAAALVLSALLGLAMGSARLGFGEVAQAPVGKGGETARLIVWQLRLPRVAGALLARAGLAVAGLLLQKRHRQRPVQPQRHRRERRGGPCRHDVPVPVSHGVPSAARGGFLRAPSAPRCWCWVCRSRWGTTPLKRWWCWRALPWAHCSMRASRFYHSFIRTFSPLMPRFPPAAFSGVYAGELAVPAVIVAAGLAGAQGACPAHESFVPGRRACAGAGRARKGAAPCRAGASKRAVRGYLCLTRACWALWGWWCRIWRGGWPGTTCARWCPRARCWAPAL